MGALAKTRSLPQRRWRIGALLGIGVLVNYLDRLNLSVAAPQLQSALNLSPAQVGWFLSAFFWSYALCQVPAGVLLDRLGPTRVGRWKSIISWAICLIVAQPWASSHRYSMPP